MTRNWKIGIGIGVGLLALLIYLNLDARWDLEAANEAARLSEQRRLEEIAAFKARDEENQRRLEEANQRTEQLLKIAEQAQRASQAALASATQIREQLKQDLSRIPDLTDTGLTVAARAGALQTYPDTVDVEIRYDGSQFLSTRSFVEASAKSFAETVSLRAENQELRTAVDSLQSQVSALLAAVDSRQVAVSALESRISGLETLRLADDARIKGLEKQLSAERRKRKIEKVVDWGARALALFVGYKIGSSI